MNHPIYIAIDLKSFYASVECVERKLDPLTTNLVVADVSRTEKTICLAVSPSLKAYGISGRARLFEVVQRVREINAQRSMRAPGRRFTGASQDAEELKEHPELAVDYIAAPYLKSNNLSVRDFARRIIHDVFETTGITATAGIGTNLYLCKVALDIVAKHVEPDEDGVRIAELDEMSYRRLLWAYRPLTDFWRVGGGYAKKLEANGMFTMGDIARCSIGKPGEYHNEDLLYRLFGINAELLIDHAWGWEPCTIADIKAYKPNSNSVGSGQVLHYPYTFEQARLIVMEMADLLALDLMDKGLVTDQIVLTVGYDRENLTDPARNKSYKGPVTVDRYGRRVPKHAHGTGNLEHKTSLARPITDAVLALYDKIVDPRLLVRRVYLTANRVVSEGVGDREDTFEQLDLFTDYGAREKKRAEEKAALEKEKRMQQTILSIKKKYGKNAVLKGMNLREGATTADRNNQIGGHKA